MSLDFITPEELAAMAGWSPRKVRALAKELGACSILGNRMVLRPCDVVIVLKATKPTLSVDDVKGWLAEETQDLIHEGDAQGWAAPTGLVYFVLRQNEVKIGYTTDLAKRLHNFRTATTDPLTVLLTISGTPDLEAYFHTRFATYNVAREWFRYSEELAEFIAKRQFTL